MQTSKLFMKLPEYICTPDGLEVDHETGELVLACPNFADLSIPSCLCKIDRNGNIRKWFDIPLNEVSHEARCMGIGFGPDRDIYIVDNQGWTGREDMIRQGRILRIRMNGDVIQKVTVVADGMEHPNGLRIRGNYMYVTQSTLELVETADKKLMSCVYRFDLNDENIHIKNTLEDPNIFLTFKTENPDCQYGVDGIIFDEQGNLFVGNFGDGSVSKTTFHEDGSIKEHIVEWAKDPEELKSTDGMTLDRYGNIYVADFSANAIAKIDTHGKVKRIAVSPDTDGLHGELDQPGEPCVWGDDIIISCFDLVTDEGKVNTAHEMPATLCMLKVEA